MLLDAKEKIGGFPILRVRDSLKRLRDFSWATTDLARSLKTTETEALKVLGALEALEYVRRHDPRALPERWEVTEKAARFVNAQGGKGITRKAATRAVEEFLDRVREVNADPNLLYSIRRVLVFGSFLSDKERLGDVDLAVTLERREADPDRFEDAIKKRVGDAAAKGRTFSTFLDLLAWPEQEVYLQLKSRSRSLKIHTDQDRVLGETKTRVLYELP